MGMVTRALQRATTSSLNPGPSLPSRRRSSVPVDVVGALAAARDCAIIRVPLFHARLTASWSAGDDGQAQGAAHAAAQRLPRKGLADAPQRRSPLPLGLRRRGSARRSPRICTSTAVTMNARGCAHISDGAVTLRRNDRGNPDVTSRTQAANTFSSAAMTSTPTPEHPAIRFSSAESQP